MMNTMFYGITTEDFISEVGLGIIKMGAKKGMESILFLVNTCSRETFQMEKEMGSASKKDMEEKFVNYQSTKIGKTLRNFHSMKDIGSMERNMGKGNSLTNMESSIQDLGNII